MTNSLRNALNLTCDAICSEKNISGHCAICDNILKKAQSIGFSFSLIDSKVFCFTGTHWEVINKIELKAFLSFCNCKIKNDFIKGNDHSELEKLLKQFPYTILSMNTEQKYNKINFQNGTLNLLTNNLEQYNWQDYFRYVLPYKYDPNAECPIFREYLNRVMPDIDAQKVLSEYIGWLFVKDLKLEKVLFLYGAGCNGKSVFVDIIETLVGKDNVSHESISDMCNGERGANHRANVIGKLLNTCSDVAPNAFAGDVFKRMASGEPVSAKVLYEDVITTTNYPKMMFCLNELPKTNDLSSGYFRRFIVAPFNVQIPKHEIDPKLVSKIIATELPGIMNWALEGRSRLVKQQAFSDCELFDSALEKYRRNATGNSTMKPLILLPPFI